MIRIVVYSIAEHTELFGLNESETKTRGHLMTEHKYKCNVNINLFTIARAG